MVGYKKQILQRINLREIEDNKLVKIEKRLLEVFKSALLQLDNALNGRNESDIKEFSIHSLKIIENLIGIYNLELSKEPNKKSLLNKKSLFLEMYDALEKEEYSRLAKLNAKLKKL